MRPVTRKSSTLFDVLLLMGLLVFGLLLVAVRLVGRPRRHARSEREPTS